MRKEERVFLLSFSLSLFLSLSLPSSFPPSLEDIVVEEPVRVEKSIKCKAEKCPENVRVSGAHSIGTG